MCVSLVMTLPANLDAQLRRETGLNLFEYHVLVELGGKDTPRLEALAARAVRREVHDAPRGVDQRRHHDVRGVALLRVGLNAGPRVDIAVDPLEGTTLCAKDMPGSIATMAMADGGTLLHAPDVYMQKIAVGPGYAKGVVELDATPADNVKRLAKAKGVDPSGITVLVLDRPRHAELIAQVRETGARIRLISDGDVAGAIAAARPESGTDLLIGTGGTPEGIIAAAAMRCMGGALQARLAPTDDAERQKAIDAGHDLDRILSTDDVVSGQNVFFTATGVTDDDLLRGVRYSGGGAHTQSIVMRSKSGTVRVIEAYNRLDKLREYASIDFTGDANAAAPMP